MKERDEQGGKREGGREEGRTIVIKTEQVDTDKEFSLVSAVG